MKHRSLRILARLMTVLLTVTMLAGIIPVTVQAASVPTVSPTEVTTVNLAECYESIGHVSKDKGNLYLETTLGDPYFDGVRVGDKLTMHINVEKAGTYQWCMVTGWARDVKNGTFTLYIDGEEASTLKNQVGGIDWRIWLDSTISTVSLPAGNHELTIVFGSDGPNVLAVKFAPEGVDMTVPEGVVQLCNADSGTPVQITDTYAIQFCTTVPFDWLTVGCPSYNNNIGSLRFDLFAWKDNYDTTISGKVLATKDFINFKDNETLKLTLNAKQSAGEYLLLMTNISDSATEQIGVWTSSQAPANVRNYQGGIEVANAARMNVHYYGVTDTPLGPISVNAEASAPVYEEITESMKDLSAYNLPASSLYHNAVMMPDTWVFTDALGRTSLTNADVGDVREDRTLAMFYWIWHATFSRLRTPLNVQAFIDERTAQGIPMESYIYDFNYPEWPSAMGAQYFWDEPIWGFYASDDKWVQRKQAELLTAAGVDVVFSDNSNATLVWQDAYPALYETWFKAQKDGVDTPKISYLMPFAAGSDTKFQLEHYYTTVFHDGNYRSLWFWWDGKPMLMAYPQSLDSSILDKQIADFFTFRPGQPSYFKKREIGTWGWLSVYPQATHLVRAGEPVEQMTVGVAQNANYEHNELAAMNGGPIMGRSYTKDKSHIGEENSTLWGYNFAEQFEYALKTDPKVIFVTGWNEWCASRYEVWPDGGHSMVTNAFPDQFNDEYSRDLEPSRGALGDNYYYQFVNFARRYKGAQPLPVPTQKTTIDLSAGQAQWADVGPYYAASIGNIGDRDADGYLGTHYSDYSGRNDIIGAQVARDDEYIYFNVECASDITSCKSKLWMNLYIDCDQDNAGWNTFDYVINKSAASASTVVLEKFTGTGYSSEKVADCAYTLDGRYMTVAVKKSDLGLSGYDFTINFTWTDNVHDVDDEGIDTVEGLDYTVFSGNILDFYTSGDVAPGGRFKYTYISTAANAGVVTDTEADTEAPTEPASLPETVVPATEPDTQPEQGGCASALAAVALPAAAAAVLFIKKKDEDPD